MHDLAGLSSLPHISIVFSMWPDGMTIQDRASRHERPGDVHSGTIGQETLLVR